MNKTLNKVFNSRIGIYCAIVAYELVLIGLSYFVWVIFKYDIYGLTWMEYVTKLITAPSAWQLTQLIIGAIIEIVGMEIIYRGFKADNAEMT